MNVVVPQPSFFYNLEDVTAIAESCPLLKRYCCYIYSINTITPLDAERLRSRWSHISELRLVLFDATNDATLIQNVWFCVNDAVMCTFAALPVVPVDNYSAGTVCVIASLVC